VFWLSSLELNRAEAVGLKATYSALGMDDRFVMLGVNLDFRSTDARSRVADYGWRWLQSEPETGHREIEEKYGAFDSTSRRLTGPDGKIVAESLRGAAIKEAVKRALQRK